jgi:hypothetical protein
MVQKRLVKFSYYNSKLPATILKITLNIKGNSTIKITSNVIKTEKEKRIFLFSEYLVF